MRLIIFSLFFTLTCVLSKTNTKPLSESMGQEVIEIGTPLKELPSDLEEEPSAEADEDDPTTASTPPATKKEAKKTTVTEVRKKGKDIDVGDAGQDDEAKVEKELAEMYKDNNDYNTDVTEATTTEKDNDTEALRSRARDTYVTTTTAYSRPTAGHRPPLITRFGLEFPHVRTMNFCFKFQPDLNNPKEIERFRTSVDEISCDKHVTRKLDNPGLPDSAAISTTNILLLGLCVSCFFVY